MSDLENFVNQSGRDKLVKDVRKKIEELGITYIYYQFVSVTGRIVGKGVPADHWESLAEKGFQLVYGATANLFVDLNVVHPFWMIFFLIITCLSFCMFGFIIGLFAKNFEHLQFTPTLILTPLIFLGGSFYSIEMLPKFWQLVSLFNPIVYLISGFRWAFFGFSDVSIQISIVVSLVFFIGCFSVIWIIFYTGYKIRN